MGGIPPQVSEKSFEEYHLYELHRPTTLHDQESKQVEFVRAAGVSAKVLALTQVDDLLSVPGFTPATVAKLKDLVVFLPVQTAINVNTASAQVISARIAGISLSDAQQLVTSRDRAYFKDLADFGARWVNSKVPVPSVAEVNTQTNYFIVHGKVRIDRSSLDVDALVERAPVSGNTRIVWVREN